MNHLYEKTIKSNSIYSGKIIDLQVDEVELPNGKTSKREIIKHPGAVAILPITTEGKLILVRQFRKALEKTIIEIPAGKLDAGEEPADCAKRELAEETGYVTDNLDFLLSFYTSPGFADELIYMYVATGLTAGEVSRDEDEFLDVVEVTLEEAVEMVRDERIHDAKTAYAIQYMRLMKYLGK
ncbi:NUDIX hydrolase [Alkalihalophilus pseudofirmus]|uniref:NUDIX domain-containing protein n=1 Tax=Alkalihalophilus pseudofirmus TaxID=79885 RepID=UPI00259B34B5|nr:NUDIX hydrolase [Alkalihalophilus pseudofirmus]WEG18202.1 NUDIX hydrolase [Alkalihalophilus pseudofirmus]